MAKGNLANLKKMDTKLDRKLGDKPEKGRPMFGKRK